MPSRMVRRGLALAMTVICMAGTAARADDLSVGYYSVTATRNFNDLNQHALSIGLPLRWSALRDFYSEMTITGGVLEQQRDRRGFISVGLTLEFRPSGARWFADAGFAPTYIGHADYADGERLGAPFQFTTHFELGRALGNQRRHAIAIRLQHTSNGGFSEPNPGLDMVGIAYHRLLGRRAGGDAVSRATRGSAGLGESGIDTDRALRKPFGRVERHLSKSGSTTSTRPLSFGFRGHARSYGGTRARPTTFGSRCGCG